MQEPIRILSDLHLGHPSAYVKNVSQLRPLIEGAGTVIFNGDTYQALAIDLEEEAVSLYQTLKALCVSLGVEAVFLPGNHDPYISETLYLELYGKKVALFHGDIIFPEVSPWSQYYLAARSKIDQLIQRYHSEHASVEARYDLSHRVIEAMRAVRRPLKGQSKVSYFIDMLWPPKRFWALVRTGALSKKAVVQVCGEIFPQAHVVIYGHFHKARIHQRNGVTYINTGALMRACNHSLVEIHIGVLKVFRIDKDKEGVGLFRFSKQLYEKIL